MAVGDRPSGQTRGQPSAVPDVTAPFPCDALLEGVGVPVFIKDRDLLFRDCNALLASRVLGVARADLLGKSAADVMGPAAKAHENRDRALLADADAGGRSPQVYDMPIRYADGARGHARFIELALRDPSSGAVIGLVGMIVDITEDHGRIAALGRASTNAGQANAEKDRFLVNMSHQLRTPLNNVIGNAEALMMGVFGPLNDMQRDYMDSIIKAGRHMESVFAVVLDVARQTEPGHGTGESWVDLHSLCVAVIQGILPDAAAVSVTLGLHEDEALAGRALKVDEAAIRHILHNLLTNAVAFSAAGNQVDLSTKLERDRLLIRVSDSGGGGVTADRVRRILSPTAGAASHSSSEPPPVAAVGLTIVKTLVAALGGAFELNSVPGRGTVATVRLPANRLGPAPRG